MAKAYQNTPILVVGDFNCEVDKLSTLTDNIAESGWVDLGAKAGIWNRPENVGTCLGHGARKPPG